MSALAFVISIAYWRHSIHKEMATKCELDKGSSLECGFIDPCRSIEQAILADGSNPYVQRCNELVYFCLS